MKPSTIVFTLLLVGCATDRLTVTAVISYIEPFPFASPLGHHALQNTQGAWITRADTGDSMAVLFDYRTSGGGDIQKKISVGMNYHFTLKPFEIIQDSISTPLAGVPDSATALISSLPAISILDSHLVVKAKKFWLVLSVDQE